MHRKNFRLYQTIIQCCSTNFFACFNLIHGKGVTSRLIQKLFSSGTSLKKEEEHDKKIYQAEAVKKKHNIPLVLDFLKYKGLRKSEGRTKYLLSTTIDGQKRQRWYSNARIFMNIMKMTRGVDEFVTLSRGKSLK